MRYRSRRLRITKRTALVISILLLTAFLIGRSSGIVVACPNFSIELKDDILSLFGRGVFHDRNTKSGQGIKLSKCSIFPKDQSVDWLPRYWGHIEGFADGDGGRLICILPDPNADQSAPVVRMPLPVQWQWLIRARISPIVISLLVFTLYLLWLDRPFPTGCCQRCGYIVAETPTIKCPECGNLIPAG